jgi:hypothetical protein
VQPLPQPHPPTEGGGGAGLPGCLCIAFKAMAYGIYASQSSSYLQHLRGCSLATALVLLQCRPLIRGPRTSGLRRWSAGDSASLYGPFPDSSQPCPTPLCFRNPIQGIPHPVLHTVPFPQCPTPAFLRVPDLSRVYDPHPAGLSPGLLLPSCCSSHTSKENKIIPP